MTQNIRSGPLIASQLANWTQWPSLFEDTFRHLSTELQGKYRMSRLGCGLPKLSTHSRRSPNAAVSPPPVCLRASFHSPPLSIFLFHCYHGSSSRLLSLSISLSQTGALNSHCLGFFLLTHLQEHRDFFFFFLFVAPSRHKEAQIICAHRGFAEPIYPRSQERRKY